MARGSSRCLRFGLVRTALCSSPLSSHARNWVGNACLIGFAFGSPLLLLLGNPNLRRSHHLGICFVACRAVFCTACAMQRSYRPNARAAGRLPVCRWRPALASHVRLAFNPDCALSESGIPREKRVRNLIALFLPLCAALTFHSWLSYARFGSLTGVNFDYYINPVHSEFAHQFGVFSPRRILHSLADYFSLRFPSFHRYPPFLAADRHSYDYPRLFSNPFSEVYLSVSWCSSWLVFGAIMGIICLVRHKGAHVFERGVAGSAYQCLCILSFFALAERYAADLYPFLIFCLVIFLRSGGVALVRSRQVIIGLVALSVIVNSVATVSWLVDADQNVPAETKAAWERLLGRRSL